MIPKTSEVNLKPVKKASKKSSKSTKRNKSPEQPPVLPMEEQSKTLFLLLIELSLIHYRINPAFRRPILRR